MNELPFDQPADSSKEEPKKVNKVPLNKPARPGRNLLEEKNNQLVVTLNKIINEIDNFFKDITIKDISYTSYNYIFDDLINYNNDKSIIEFKNDLEKNGYNAVFTNFSNSKELDSLQTYKTKLTVNLMFSDVRPKNFFG